MFPLTSLPVHAGYAYVPDIKSTPTYPKHALNKNNPPRNACVSIGL